MDEVYRGDCSKQFGRSAMQQYKRGETIGGEYEVKQDFGGEGKSGMGVVYLVSSREIPKPFAWR
jgi:hypothetical protein